MDQPSIARDQVALATNCRDQVAIATKIRKQDRQAPVSLKEIHQLHDTEEELGRGVFRNQKVIRIERKATEWGGGERGARPVAAGPSAGLRRVLRCILQRLAAVHTCAPPSFA
jgi:hypothetical protein